MRSLFVWGTVIHDLIAVIKGFIIARSDCTLRALTREQATGNLTARLARHRSPGRLLATPSIAMRCDTQGHRSTRPLGETDLDLPVKLHCSP
jgi:hypothetical protein